MKHMLLTLVVFSLAITALHAQVLPGTVPPALAPDPALEQVVQSLLPAQYTAYTVAVTVILMLLLRVAKARKNGLSWSDSLLAAFTGTNVPVIIGALSLLILPSCVALSTPKAKQMELSLAQAGLIGAVASGVLSPGDAVTIAQGIAVLTSADDGTSKVMKIEKLGLDTAISKGLVKPGDIVQIKETSALITSPPPVTLPAPILPVVVGNTSGK